MTFVAWEDSIEMLSSLYWTPSLLTSFEQDRGYSALPCLPALFKPQNNWNAIAPSYNEMYTLGNQKDSACSADYRRTLNAGYQDYMTHFSQWTHRIGIQYSHQPAYNLPLEMVRLLYPHRDGSDPFSWVISLSPMRQNVSR